MPTMPNSDAIAALAYQYWEAEGCPHGRDLDHWLKAEQTLTIAPASRSKTAEAKGPAKITRRRVTAEARV